MSTLEELQKENTDLKDSVYHLKDLVDVLLAKIRIAESCQVEHSIPQQNLNEIKAQAIEEVVKECMSTSDDVMVKAKATQMMCYANKLRSEK